MDGRVAPMCIIHTLSASVLDYTEASDRGRMTNIHVFAILLRCSMFALVPKTVSLEDPLREAAVSTQPLTDRRNRKKRSVTTTSDEDVIVGLLQAPKFALATRTHVCSLAARSVSLYPSIWLRRMEELCPSFHFFPLVSSFQSNMANSNELIVVTKDDRRKSQIKCFLYCGWTDVRCLLSAGRWHAAPIDVDGRDGPEALEQSLSIRHHPKPRNR